MRVGVPKEIKVHEYRVGMTPASVSELVAAGHEVVVETKAGSGIDCPDRGYEKAGAQILPDAASVFKAAGSSCVVVRARWSRRLRCSSRGIFCSPISTSPLTSRRRRD